MEMAFSGTTVFVLLAVLVAIVIGLILYFRKRLNGYDIQHLRDQHAQRERTDLLATRTKYPEVDAFRLSNTFLKFSLLTSLLIVLLAFNWTTFEEQVYIPEGALDMAPSGM